jgi:hypothetical protein
VEKDHQFCARAAEIAVYLSSEVEGRGPGFESA